MRFDSDAIDECCQELFGHTNWEYVQTKPKKDGHCVMFHQSPINEDGEDLSSE